MKPTYNFKRGGCPTCFATKRDVIATAELTLMHRDPFLKQIFEYVCGEAANKINRIKDDDHSVGYKIGYVAACQELVDVIRDFPELKEAINRAAEPQNEKN